jgi:hypothetical protein
MLLNRLDYCQFLLTSPVNYTLTYFADHVSTLSHDRVNRYLRDDTVTSDDLWHTVQETLVMSSDGYLLFDDTVLDKRHSAKIENVYKQFSGNEHKVIKGIGVVTCVYVNPGTKQFWAVDYRIYDPLTDAKSKLDHVQEMLTEAIEQKNLTFSTVLMDSWYATQKLMKFIDEQKKIYYTVVKKNRLVDETQGAEAYQRVGDLEWSEQALLDGKRLKLNGFPANHKVQLFWVTVLPGKTEFVVTNDLSCDSSQQARRHCKVRWKIEEFHREIKQLTGIESCQCRKGIIQKNHIGCAMLVWAKLKQLAYQTGKTIYQLKHSLLDDYMIQALANPTLQLNFA